MKIAIASGKGGTGKTTVATNLALLLGERGENVVYLDCDVEEPNGHLFLKPSIDRRIAATIPVPVIDESKCTACGECVKFCQYNALVRLGKTVMVFPELCHGCGGCMLLCPQKAISERDREIGIVETGRACGVCFANGRLNIGEAMSPPLIREVLRQSAAAAIAVIDAPPGTSCPVITSLRTADFVMLVTEPTPFGLHDLGMALDMVRELDVPHGVVVNRAEAGNIDAESFCAQRQVAVIAQLPDDRRVAEAYSRGEMVLTAVPSLRRHFETIWEYIRGQVHA
ncbi:MAG: ATP-binding protein [Chitinispirillaceae bacterium]|nr:ATP-binding protein [Chitinispirillaceae bacterium]